MCLDQLKNNIMFIEEWHIDQKAKCRSVNSVWKVEQHGEQRVKSGATWRTACGKWRSMENIVWKVEQHGEQRVESGATWRTACGKWSNMENSVYPRRSCLQSECREVNFIFFLNILRVLFTKLNAVNSQEAKKFRYRKLAKSTLVLIPLFGVHYIVFAGLPTDVNHTAELIQLYFEMFFNSVQGFFVTVLFCFMNGEVQSEIKKKWQRFRITRLHHLPKGRSNSHNVTYATYLSRPRESNASVTQLPEQAGDGSYKGRNSSLTYKDSAISLLPLKGGGNAKGRIAEAEEQSLMMRQMSGSEFQGHYNGLT